MKKIVDTTVPLLVITLLLSLLLLVLLWGIFDVARQHDDEKTELTVLSNDMLHDNNRLIRLMHLYIMNREPRYLEEYLQILRDPETFEGRIKRMKEIGLTDYEIKEIELLEESLAQLEGIRAGILRDIGNGDFEQAIAVIYGDKYIEIDFLILQSIQNIIDSIENRSAETTQMIASQLRVSMLVFSVAFVGLIALLYIVYRNNRKLREREHEANEAKSRFLAMTSHEIRTPMNAILGIAEMQMQNESISEETEEALGRIYESGSLLLNIINDILDLTKIEAGKLEITPIRYDVPSLVSDTIQLNRLRFQSKLIDFHLEIDEQTPLNLFGDELRIRQILGNILSNAYKYTGSGEVRMTVSAEIIGDAPVQELEAKGVLKKDDVILVVTISDTGQGMSEEQLESLFDEYTRYNKEKNLMKEGVGLGMSITKRLLDLLGGEIAVESKVDVGSIFTVRIPQKRVDELVCGEGMSERLNTYRYLSVQAEKRGPVIREYMPYGKVLIVDDVASNLYVASGLLVPYGLEINTATGGREAIEMIKAGNVYDIVFMDHMMPGMDGFEAVRILREMGYNGSIVALTANAIVGQADNFLNNGFDDYVSKPIDSRELDRVLHTLIRDKKPAEIVEAARRERAAQSERKKGGAQGGQTTQKKDIKQEQPRQQNLSEDLDEYFIFDVENAINTLMSITTPSGDIFDNEIDTYEITIHGLKSTLHNVGEKLLSMWAYKLERAAGERNLEMLKEETPAIIDALKALLDEKKKDQTQEQ